MSDYLLAQLNIATALHPLDSPELLDFVSNLDAINELAESSPGFVWRLQTEDGDATSIRHFGDNIVVNMSTWRSIETLQHFTYHTAHAQFIGRRKEWFSKMKTYSVLWWIEASHEPTIDEAAERLAAIELNGPTVNAFTFKNSWPAPLDQ